MEIFYAVCLGIITASMVTATVYLVMTLIQLKATARAVEQLAVNANERVESTRNFFEAVNSVSSSVQSVWFKALQAGMGLIAGFRR